MRLICCYHHCLLLTISAHSSSRSLISMLVILLSSYSSNTVSICSRPSEQRRRNSIPTRIRTIKVVNHQQISYKLFYLLSIDQLHELSDSYSFSTDYAETKFKEVMVSYEAIKSERKNNGTSRQQVILSFPFQRVLWEYSSISMFRTM